MIIGLIPARSGSKGIPGKNVKILAGKPLLAWAAAAAIETGAFSRLILSTDDAEIASVGRRYGLETPWLRPAHLAEDDTPMSDVVRHALRLLPGDSSDKILLLQPTAPLRKREHLSVAITMLEAPGVDSVVSVVRIPEHYSPEWAFAVSPRGRLERYYRGGTVPARRQDVRPAYSRDGTVYAFWRATWDHQHSIYGDHSEALVIPPHESVNLDSLLDWERAERMMGQRCLGHPPR